MILAPFIILSSFPVVYAQENASDEFTLKEITVTAEKRAADVQKTALSVTAINGDNIRERSMGSNTVPVPGSAGNLKGGGPGPVTVPDEDGDGVGDDVLSPDPDNPGSFIYESNGIVDIIDTGWILPAGADAWTNDIWHIRAVFSMSSARPIQCT